jgi:cell division protein FtsL
LNTTRALTAIILGVALPIIFILLRIYGSKKTQKHLDELEETLRAKQASKKDLRIIQIVMGVFILLTVIVLLFLRPQIK